MCLNVSNKLQEKMVPLSLLMEYSTKADWNEILRYSFHRENMVELYVLGENQGFDFLYFAIFAVAKAFWVYPVLYFFHSYYFSFSLVLTHAISSNCFLNNHVPCITPRSKSTFLKQYCVNGMHALVKCFITFTYQVLLSTCFGCSAELLQREDFIIE